MDINGEELQIFTVMDADSYFRKIHDIPDEVEDFDYYTEHKEEFELIDQILAAEVAYYMLRRTSHKSAGISESMKEIKVNLIEKYEKDFGKYADFNENIDW